MAGPANAVNKKWLLSTELREFAEWVWAGKDKRVVLTMNRAGWHISKDVDLPEGLHLLPLPAHSPELQFPISTILGN